jgi:hypothetical protein
LLLLLLVSLLLLLLLVLSLLLLLLLSLLLSRLLLLRWCRHRPATHVDAAADGVQGLHSRAARRATGALPVQ